MIKEYMVTIVHNVTEHEKQVFASIDLSKIVTIRMAGDNDDKTFIDFQGGDGLEVHEEYEQVLKDWSDARCITPIRVATIGS